MKKVVRYTVVLSVVGVLAGCAKTPEVPLNNTVWKHKNRPVKVALSTAPKANLHLHRGIR